MVQPVKRTGLRMCAFINSLCLCLCICLCLCLSLSLSLCLCFNGLFPGEPGLASFIEAKDDGSGGDNCSYKTCKPPVQSSSPTNQHQTFYRPAALPVTKPTVSEQKEKN